MFPNIYRGPLPSPDALHFGKDELKTIETIVTDFNLFEEME
jgi:hypothetical protein